MEKRYIIFDKENNKVFDYKRGVLGRSYYSGENFKYYHTRKLSVAEEWLERNIAHLKRCGESGDNLVIIRYGSKAFEKFKEEIGAENI